MKVVEQLLPINKWTRPGRKIESMRFLAIHFTGSDGGSNESLYDYMLLQQKLDQIYEEAVKSGASEEELAKLEKPRYTGCTYSIGMYGGIMRMVPEDEVVYHIGSAKPDPVSGKNYTDYARALFGENACSGGVITPNFYSNGIEVNFPNKNGKFSPETLNDLVALIRDYKRRYPRIQIGTHKDVVGWKDCPYYYVKNPQAMKMIYWAVENDYTFK